MSFATYNERDNLGPLVAEVLQTVPSADVLVIDDNSPDGTGKLADQMALADRRIRVLMRLPARDCSGAYRCYRVAKLKDAHLDRMISRGYSFQQEVLFRCHKAGFRIGETPIVFEERRAGASKVNLHESVRSLSILM